MTLTDFKTLLQDPTIVLSPSQTRELEAILEEYPYFQAARALHLKGLKNLESYKYNAALKMAAAHTADREILFDYITSREFDQNHIANSIAGRETTLKETKTVSEEIEPNPDTEIILGKSDENPLPQNISHAEKILDPSLFDPKKEESETQIEPSAEEELELGKPLSFTKNERHSFSEWLQLTQQKKFERAPEEGPKKVLEKKKKFELVDQFIENKPKIVPDDTFKSKIDIEESTKLDKSELMTQTLAKVYLEQKKYKKAIQAYKILSLKYPEKSGFFADRIKAVKKLQKEKES